MSYQAVIRNTENNLVTSSLVGMQVSIIQGSSSGNVVYAETHTPTSNANGLISVEIGDGASISGVFSAIEWENGPYFIKTETDPSGGTSYTITGISQLLSVPYALHAKTAESIIGNDNTLWETSNSDIYYLDGNVGIGTNNPSVLNYSHPTKVLSFKNPIGTTAIEMLGQRNSDGESIGWFTYLNDMNRLVDVVVTRENNGTSGSFRIRTNNGNGGINPNNMVEQFTITNSGDVYLNDFTNGIIMKSMNGQCWKFTVDNLGNLSSNSIPCPL